METKNVEEPPEPANPFQQHRNAWRRLSEAEETTDLENLDALSLREKVASLTADASEKWMQQTFAVQIERARD